MEGVKFEKPKEYTLKEGFRAKRFESKEGSQDKYVTTMKMILECFGRLSEKVFTITTDNFKNPTVITLTDVSDATISITLVKEKTLY